MQAKKQSKDEQKLVLFQPKTLTLFSNFSNISAWLNLVIAILYLIFEFFYLDQQIAQTTIMTSFSMSGHWWEWRNITDEVVLKNVFSVVITTASLAGNFFLFKSISIGLNVLLELGFTIIPDDEEETENE